MNRNATRFAFVAAGFVACAPVIARALKWAYSGEGRAPGVDDTHASREAGRRPQASTDWHQEQLTRLSNQVRQARAGEATGRLTRIRAATTAYDDALIDTCRAVGVPFAQPSGPLSDTDRLEIETQLVAAGMSW